MDWTSVGKTFLTASSGATTQLWTHARGKTELWQDLGVYSGRFFKRPGLNLHQDEGSLGFLNLLQFTTLWGWLNG